jgi:hypothetical protein
MSRPSRQAAPVSQLERLRQDAARARTLRQLYPQLSQLRIEFEFEDGTSRSISPQSFTYFPAARGFFRYACPCHGCSGEFDLSDEVAELATRSTTAQRSRRVSVPCAGQRARDVNTRVACPICARVRVIAIVHSTD